MSGILFDTSVYISALRQGDETILSLRRAARLDDHKTRPLWLSAVVLHELYVGAEGARARKELQRLEREFVRVDRLLIPSRIDWTTAGFALSKIVQDKEFVARHRHKSFRFGEKREISLQAADLLAYELHVGLRNIEIEGMARDMRWPLEQFVTREFAPVGVYYDKDKLRGYFLRTEARSNVLAPDPC